MKLQTTDKSEVDSFTSRGIPRSHYKINKSIKLHVLTDSNIDYFGLLIGFVDSNKLKLLTRSHICLLKTKQLKVPLHF